MRNALLALALVHVHVLAGCWTSSTTPQPAEAPDQDSPPIAAHFTTGDDALPARTIWRGRYECAQGWTALQLTLEVAPDGRAVAIFDFGALADNPTVPSGSYRLVGMVAESPERTELTLSPERWISQPDGYEMVPLTARTDRKRTRLRGRIERASCGELDLERVVR